MRRSRETTAPYSFGPGPDYCVHGEDRKVTLDDGDVYCVACDRLASEGRRPEPEPPPPAPAVDRWWGEWERDHIVPTLSLRQQDGPLSFIIRIEQHGEEPLYVRHEVDGGKLSAVHTSKDGQGWAAPYLMRRRRLEQALLKSFGEGKKNLEKILDALVPEEGED